jgi:hypothetical protein
MASNADRNNLLKLEPVCVSDCMVSPLYNDVMANYITCLTNSLRVASRMQQKKKERGMPLSFFFSREV